MINHSCPSCARFALTLDLTHSRHRVRCDQQKGGCGWRVEKWHRNPDDALALYKLVRWQIEHDRTDRKTLTLRKAA
ncbi:hypothetical protein NB644_09730 [Oxalobacter formigenes]|uniref:hypothetical protein n=1 Tax=Oxalobacter formigenes TaxID=847 RepID=UPI0022B03422|nr:hypothetical protein [Oxalobacter formigenes]WAW01215.1 hypothetical protein NB644_09730 [Oxalobacter formigenes]WAW03544.1 hypothetical protein NB642_10505 [Oxalobacter formigenes]